MDVLLLLVCIYFLIGFIFGLCLVRYVEYGEKMKWIMACMVSWPIYLVCFICEKIFDTND